MIVEKTAMIHVCTQCLARPFSSACTSKTEGKPDGIGLGLAVHEINFAQVSVLLMANCIMQP